MTRAATQARLEQALTRLLAGQPAVSDGALTIASLCREAGLGRDSYYRSPQHFKHTVTAAFASRDAQQPELLALREQVAELKRQRKQTAREHSRTVRELEETTRVYANQIQALALRNAELEEQVRRERERHLTRLFPADARHPSERLP